MVSGAPRSMLTEVDNSQYWTETSGLGVYLGITAKAGPLVPTYMPDIETLYSTYTLNGKIESSDDVAFHVAKRLINTTGLGVYVNRVAPENVTYGGCVIPIGSGSVARSLTIGLANPEDITFKTGSTGIKEKCSITFKDDVNGNTGGTAFWLQGKQYYVTFEISGSYEINKFKCNADVNGNLGGAFITLPAGTGYIWFNSGSSTNPGTTTRSLNGLTGYEISVLPNASAATIASAIAAVSVTGLQLTATDDTVTITVQNANEVQPGNSGSSGFTFTRTSVGAPAIPAFTTTEGTTSFITKSVYTCIADTAGSLSGKYVILPNKLGYAWFNNGGTGTDPGTTTPELVGLTGYPIAITDGATAATVATAFVAAVAAITSATFTVDAIDNKKVIAKLTTTTELTGTNLGSAGNSGFQHTGTCQGSAIKITISYNTTASSIAANVFTALSNIVLSDIFAVEMDGSNSNILKVESIQSGAIADAETAVESPAPVLIQTVTQGSGTAGTDAVFFYYNNPSDKANDYGIKLFSFEEYPEKAPKEGTFVVEVYTRSDTKTPESSITCSRDPDAVDDYNNSIYVEDVLKLSTNIRAINNTDTTAAPYNQVPKSIPDILWFGGGNSGSFTDGAAKLSAYINAVQPIVDKEEYAVSLLLPGGYYASAYLQELDRIAQKRGDAVLLTGVLSDREKAVNYLSAIETWMNEEVVLTSSYSSVFSPAAKAYDSDTNRTIELPIECCVAEQIAFANENYSISYPILGFARGTLQNISGLVRKYKFSDDGTQDGDKLYDMRVNPIRQFKDQGYVIWGQKTTQRVASARDRLNVRLMLIALKPLINQVQLGLIGELPTEATKKRAKNLLNSVFDVGVGRNWFKDNYSVELVEDATLEAQHILRINYKVEPYNSIEFVDGYLIIQNGIVTEIA